jgi:hypothetical protein
VSPSSHQQCPTPSNRSVEVCRAAPRQKTRLASTHLHQTETTRYCLHQNVLVTRTQIKSLYKQLLIYVTILKPIWAYGIQLWGATSTSSIEILERFQSKALRIITDAPWYVLNAIIQKDLQIPTIRHEISRYSYQYSKRLSVHPNELTLNLKEPPETRRLRKHLPTIFNM